MEKYMLKNKELEEILEKIDLNEAPPAEEPMRQYYFMKKAQMLVQKKSEELGRPLTYHVTTFGCPRSVGKETSKTFYFQAF